jgi:hypothetical protein
VRFGDGRVTALVADSAWSRSRALKLHVIVALLINKDTTHQHQTRPLSHTSQHPHTQCPKHSRQRNASFTNSSTAASAHPLHPHPPHPDPSRKAQSTNQPPSASAAATHLQHLAYATSPPQHQNPRSTQSEEREILRHGRTTRSSSACAVSGL